MLETGCDVGPEVGNVTCCVDSDGGMPCPTSNGICDCGVAEKGICGAGALVECGGNSAFA